MAYADWSNEDYERFQEEAFDNIFDNLNLSGLSGNEIDQAAVLFQTGWLNFEIDLATVYAAREDFYDLTNYPESEFDWEEFRELYDEAGG